MRKAPYWRSWIPTSRQIRHAMAARVPIVSPWLARQLNCTAFNPAWSRAATLLYQQNQPQELSLSPSTRVFFEAHGQLERARYGQIVPSAKDNFTLYDLGAGYIYGHTGAAYSFAAKGQTREIGANTARLRRLKTRRLNGRALNFMGLQSGHRHYYHFLMDYLPYLLTVLQDFAWQNEPLTLVVRPDLSPMQERLFAYLCEFYPKLNLLKLANNNRLEAVHIWQLNYDNPCEFRRPASKEKAELLRKTVLAAFEVSPCSEPWRKLYISRADARIRNLLNEAEFLPQLKSRGFEIIRAAELSIKAQLKLFDEARLVVAPHGAGLTNMLFTQNGGAVIELFPGDYVQSAFAWLATVKEHQYTPILGERSQAHQHFTLSDKAQGDLLAACDTLLEHI